MLRISGIEFWFLFTYMTFESHFSIFMAPYGASQVVRVVKNLPANAGDVRGVGLIPELGRSPGGHGKPLQYGQRSLVGSGLWGHKELDTTERHCAHTQGSVYPSVKVELRIAAFQFVRIKY